MENRAFVFVFAKNKEIKVLNIEETKRLQNSLIADGWKHTKTIDACGWIQFLYDTCTEDEMAAEIKNLSKLD